MWGIKYPLLYQIGGNVMLLPTISNRFVKSDAPTNNQSSHYGISEISQIERTYKKMNEYLYEIGFLQMEKSDLSDEEIMIEVSNRKLHTNRKKNKKENDIYGKESNYNLYC